MGLMTTLDGRPGTTLRDGRRLMFPAPAPEAKRTGSLETFLAEVIQSLVKNVPANALQPACAESAGIAYRPRALLALLGYYYALEVYSSEDIEGAMRRDAAFRHACGGEFPNAQMLRRFRRNNHGVIEQCLFGALQAIAERSGRPKSDLDARQEAHERIQTAVLMDMNV
jgi:hypothetical protein